jgi:hypothetical protein
MPLRGDRGCAAAQVANHRWHKSFQPEGKTLPKTGNFCPDAGHYCRMCVIASRSMIGTGKDFVWTQQKGGTAMKLNLTLLIAGSLACAATLAAMTETAVAAESKITILYDAFGNDAAMKKDWGFSALVEVALTPATIATSSLPM